jgi:hypothetical protein
MTNAAATPATVSDEMVRSMPDMAVQMPTMTRRVAEA